MYISWYNIGTNLISLYKSYNISKAYILKYIGKSKLTWNKLRQIAVFEHHRYNRRSHFPRFHSLPESTDSQHFRIYRNIVCPRSIVALLHKYVWIHNPCRTLQRWVVMRGLEGGWRGLSIRWRRRRLILILQLLLLRLHAILQSL